MLALAMRDQARKYRDQDQDRDRHSNLQDQDKDSEILSRDRVARPSYYCALYIACKASCRSVRGLVVTCLTALCEVLGSNPAVDNYCVFIVGILVENREFLIILHLY